MRYSILQVSLILAACLSLEAQAQTIFIEDATLHTMATPPVIEDADILLRDGVIVEVEFNEAHAEKMSEVAAKVHQMKHSDNAPGFSGIDSNADGEISEQEFSEHQAAHHQKMHKDHSKQD